MSDMRDFGNASEPLSEGNFRPVTQNFSAERIDLTGEGLENSDIRPLDDSSDMSAFHTVEPEEASNTGKIAGALAVALIIGGAGIFAFTASMHSSTSKPALVAASAPMPAQAAAATPPAPQPVPESSNSATPDNSTADNATKDNSSEALKPAPAAPVKSARAHIRTDNTRTVSETPDVTPAPQQSAAAQPSPAIGQSVMPQPVSPTPPASSYANNVPAPAATPNADTTQDMPSPQPATPDAQTAQAPAATPDQSQPVQPQPDQATAQPAAPQ